MDCEKCGEEIDNADQLKKHMELVHPMDSSDKSTKTLEGPDFVGATPEEAEEVVASVNSE